MEVVRSIKFNLKYFIHNLQTFDSEDAQHRRLEDFCSFYKTLPLSTKIKVVNYLRGTRVYQEDRDIADKIEGIFSN